MRQRLKRRNSCSVHLAIEPLLRWPRWIAILASILAISATAGCTQDERESKIKGQCPPSAASLVPKGGWTSAPPQTEDHGFLWRIEKDGHSSWLYGTAHIGKPEWMRPGPRTREALAQSDVVALETNPQEAHAQVKSLVSASSKADVASFSLDATQRERLIRLSSAACISADFAREIEKMPPARQVTLLAFLFQQIDGLYAEFGSEQYLIAYAQDAKKPLKGLETVIEQATHFAGPRDGSEKSESARIDGALSQLESGKGRKITTATADAWARGDLEKLERYGDWCDCLDTAEEKALHWRLTVGRQPTMATRIEHMHAQGRRVFAAVGAMHMVGDKGLPSLLIERGFQVSRIPFE